MRRELSVYLDLARFLAACAVFLSHVRIGTDIAWVAAMPDYGHAAVMVFFVLSGFVIAYVADTRETDPKSYSVSRAARIYSVALPAVVLTVLLDWIGSALAPQLYGRVSTEGHAFVRVLASLGFLNELWLVSIQSFSNAPYWSLCYEVWYYALFAALTFLSGSRRLWVAGLIVLVVGPKILLLAPIWWLGVVLYRWRGGYELPEWAGWVAFAGSFWLFALAVDEALALTLRALTRELLGDYLYVHLANSKFFLQDYLLGVAVFVNFLGCRAVCHRFGTLVACCGTLVRKLAGYTFSVYLYHLPLLLFFAALLHGDARVPRIDWPVILATVAAIWLLGMVTEARKDVVRSWVHELWRWVEVRLRAAACASRRSGVL